jgi:aspartate 1-decarboxylase
MQIQVLKSKIHRVKVTGFKLYWVHYYWRIIIKASIIEGEKVAIVNINNGERFETYAYQREKNHHNT